MSLADIKHSIQSLNFERIIGDALVLQQKQIIEYQKAQMLHGQTATGDKIGKYKNKDYARKKANLNPLAGYGYVDLRLHNEFQRNITIRFFSDSYVIFSTDSKAEKLVQDYGPNIFGLNAEFIDDFAETFLNDEIQQQIIKNIYL